MTIKTCVLSIHILFNILSCIQASTYKRGESTPTTVLPSVFNVTAVNNIRLNYKFIYVLTCLCMTYRTKTILLRPLSK